MKLFIHNDCGETAVERPDAVMQELPVAFPFTCLSCLGEIEDESDLTAVEMMSQ